ncbi:restriction endonuclease subunit S [Bifidobacterium breve]|uniref:restriction endonuclease subunit S n=1 Tax=Bifidobacterium breve TaxID=1685 RepID=UPI0019D3AFE1|nr:restriction endonuclease subunit S [Bifidobacterium breve]
MNTAYRMPAFFVRLCVFSTHPYFEKTNLFKFFKIEGGTVLPLMACKVSLQSLLATLIAISVANNGNDSAQVAGRCIAYVRPATRIPSALLHVVPMPAWEQRKLGEFGSVAMCKRIYKEQTSEQGDVPFFKIGTFGADPDAFISNELFEGFKRTYPYPTPGTLLISAAGSIGRIVEYQGEKAYFQDSNIVWLEHDHRLNDAFLKPLYSQIEWGLEGSTIKRLYNKDLLSAEVTIPDGKEQKEIGQFFAKLDSLITLHQRKRLWFAK